jgi:hypothetical protein
MTEVSLTRLYAMRALYLLIAVGLAFDIWPQLIHREHALTLWHGVGISLLTAMSVLAALGVRYPLKMLPLLFFELAWKAIWLTAVALPLWTAHRIDADTAQTIPECLMGIIVPIVIPWRYAFAAFLRTPGDRWR